MKIKLNSTLPFSPVQLDAHHAQPRRAVGQLSGMDGARAFSMAVYQFRHADNDAIYYQVDPRERVYLDDAMSDNTAVSRDHRSSTDRLEWVEHDDSLSYKPYAFLVMNAITKLVANWDGVVYRTPSGERLRDTAINTTLQVMDACVCNRFGLWVMVNLSADTHDGFQTQPNQSTRQLGWVPL